MTLELYREYSNNITKANKELDNVLTRFNKQMKNKKVDANYDLKNIISNCKVLDSNEVMPVSVLD
jgi:F0F1-type ATP synthase membrane subunit b/b'